jgi:hypothetical protein
MEDPTERRRGATVEALHPELYLEVRGCWLKQRHGREGSQTHLKAPFLGWWAIWPHTVILPAVNCIGPAASLGYIQSNLNSDVVALIRGFKAFSNDWCFHQHDWCCVLCQLFDLGNTSSVKLYDWETES